MIQLYTDFVDIYESTLGILRNAKYGSLEDYVPILVNEAYQEGSHQYPYKCH